MSCLHSLQATDSLTAFLDGIGETMAEFCIFSIKSTLDTTGDDPKRQSNYVNEIVQAIENVSCPGKPNACSGHGTCTKGHCHCDTGMCICKTVSALATFFKCDG